MPNSCFVFGCKSNYKSDEHVPVFKLPMKPDELRHTWIRALRRDDLHHFKGVYLHIKHFREEDIEYTHRIPNRDGTFREIARINPRLKQGAIPAFLSGHSSIHSQPTTTKSASRDRRSLDSKDEELLNETLTLSLTSESEVKEKFKINSCRMC